MSACSAALVTLIFAIAAVACQLTAMVSRSWYIWTKDGQTNYHGLWSRCYYDPLEGTVCPYVWLYICAGLMSMILGLLVAAIISAILFLLVTPTRGKLKVAYALYVTCSGAAFSDVVAVVIYTVLHRLVANKHMIGWAYPVALATCGASIVCSVSAYVQYKLTKRREQGHELVLIT